MAPKSLTIGIATRGRPTLAWWTAVTTRENAGPDTTILLLADHDDPRLEEIEVPEGVTLSVEPREDTIGGKWNRMIRLAPADVYMAMCDYRAQITPGFDQNILEAAAVYRDGIGFAFQHLANLSFPAYQSMTAKTAAIMGHFYVEHFPYWFTDHWLDDIGRMIGRVVFSPGQTAVGNREGGTQEFREPHLWASLYDALAGEREAIAEKLLAEMDEPEWRKDMLRMNWPLIHQRSRIINGLVRNMKGTATPDKRYQRIRDRAVEKLSTIYTELQRKAA